MIKKILLTVVLLLVVGGALVIYGTYKAASDFMTENEPQMRAYVQMTPEEQDNYVLTHAGELLAKIKDSSKPEDKSNMEKFEMMNKDNPELQKAMIGVGRSLMASVILLSDPIVKEMSEETKAAYQKEADEFSERLDKYEALLKDLEVKRKVTQ